MEPINIAERIAKDAHAIGLPPGLLTGLAAPAALEALFCDPALGGRQTSYAAGVALCDAHDVPADVFFVHKGQVRLHQVAPDGTSLLLEILGAGQWFGIAALAGRSTYGVRASAMVTSVVTKVSAGAVLQHACSSPEGSKALIRELARRHCDGQDDAARLVFDDCNSRLIKTLLRFSETAAATRREPEDGGGVVLRITHQQLAQAVGVARETVSLALTQLRRQNMVKTGRNQLFFDPQVLKSFQGASKRGAPATK
jgi:CRP/FNR family cyclic AMP-dependent transcriptional regulator